MKELTIVRHGKSEWDNGILSDIDRTLKFRGVNDAYLMAQHIASANIKPELIISSNAARAMHTASIFGRVLKIESSKIILNENIYLTSPNTVLEIIKSTSNNINSLMVFGHNPTFTDIANKFLPEPIDNLPTTGLAWFKFETNEWNEITRLKPIESFCQFPKNIKN